MAKSTNVCNTKIIAAFGGLGKSYFAEKYYDTVIDLESSLYQYTTHIETRKIEKSKGDSTRIQNPAWPSNYIEQIKSNLGKYKYILIVLACEVLDALRAEGLGFTVLYPELNRKEEILWICKNRGNCEEYIARMERLLGSAEDFEGVSMRYGDSVVQLSEGKFVEDYIKSIDDNLPTMPEPIIMGGFEVHGKKIKAEFFSLLGAKKFPHLPWEQVYIVGNYKGKVPVVEYKKDRDNLPGGGLYCDETIDEGIRREVHEEVNMSVLNWTPLGYQRLSDEQGNRAYQIRVYGELSSDGKWTHDDGGSVIGNKLVSINELNDRIGYGEIGEWLVEQVKDKYEP